MKPTPRGKGPGIDWPISGWPRHGPLILAFVAVLAALVLVLLFADRQADDRPIRDSEPLVQPIAPE